MEIEELNIRIDHVHMIVSIPPRISVSDYIGILKGKTAIKMFKSHPNFKKKPYWGNHFWARGYFVNTVGINEEMIRGYVKYQEDEERNAEQDRSGFSLLLEGCIIKATTPGGGSLLSPVICASQPG